MVGFNDSYSRIWPHNRQSFNGCPVRTACRAFKKPTCPLRLREKGLWLMFRVCPQMQCRWYFKLKCFLAELSEELLLAKCSILQSPRAHLHVVGTSEFTYMSIYKPTEFAHSFYFLLGVYFCLYGPFSYIFYSVSSPRASPPSYSIPPAVFLPYWSF